MNKKFLFFKLTDHIESEFESHQLSEMELQALFGSVQVIDNVFQLIQQPEIKRILEKEVDLQNALTDALANHGRHGYLWIGTELPDVMKGLFKLSYIKEVYLFQQMLDSEPEFLSASERSIPFVEYTIYLWRVYRIRTRQFLFERANYIRNIAQSEIDIDRHFEALSQSLQSPEQNRGEDSLLHYPVTTAVTFNQDKRPYSRQRNRRWIRALINTLLPEDGKTVHHLFCGSGSDLLETLMANQNATGIDINPLVIKIAQSNMYNFRPGLPEFQQAISDIISNVKMIVNETDTSQTDLFLFGTESKFLQFWNLENNRLKTLQYSIPDLLLMKYFAAARFLIETQAISRDTSINLFFLTGLINLMVGILRRKKEIDFCEEYQKRLRHIYLNCYAVNKIHEFFEPPSGKGQVEFGDVRDMSQSTADLVMIHLPVRVNKSGFEKDRAPIEIMNLHGAQKSLESKILGSRLSEENDKKDWQTLFDDEGGIFPLLNKEAMGFIDRLRQNDRKDDAVRYFALWTQHHNIVIKFRNMINEGGCVCIIAEHPVYRTEEQYEIVPLGSILLDMIRNDTKNFPDLDPQIYSREESSSKFGHVQRTSILILRHPQGTDKGDRIEEA